MMATGIVNVTAGGYVLLGTGPMTVETKGVDLRLVAGSALPAVDEEAYHFVRTFGAFFYHGEDDVYVRAHTVPGKAVFSN